MHLIMKWVNGVELCELMVKEFANFFICLCFLVFWLCVVVVFVNGWFVCRQRALGKVMM